MPIRGYLIKFLTNLRQVYLNQVYSYNNCYGYKRGKYKSKRQIKREHAKIIYAWMDYDYGQFQIYDYTSSGKDKIVKVWKLVQFVKANESLIERILITIESDYYDSSIISKESANVSFLCQKIKSLVKVLNFDLNMVIPIYELFFGTDDYIKVHISTVLKMCNSISNAKQDSLLNIETMIENGAKHPLVSPFELFDVWLCKHRDKSTLTKLNALSSLQSTREQYQSFLGRYIGITDKNTSMTVEMTLDIDNINDIQHSQTLTFKKCLINYNQNKNNSKNKNDNVDEKENNSNESKENKDNNNNSNNNNNNDCDISYYFEDSITMQRGWKVLDFDKKTLRIGHSRWKWFPNQTSLKRHFPHIQVCALL